MLKTSLAMKCITWLNYYVYLNSGARFWSLAQFNTLYVHQDTVQSRNPRNVCSVQHRYDSSESPITPRNTRDTSCCRLTELKKKARTEQRSTSKKKQDGNTILGKEVKHLWSTFLDIQHVSNTCGKNSCIKNMMKIFWEIMNYIERRVIRQRGPWQETGHGRL